MNDLNNDGKVDFQDHYLYTQISDDRPADSGHSYKSSGIGNRIWGIVAVIYLASLMNGSIGVGPIRAILGLISIVVILAWLGGGLA